MKINIVYLGKELDLSLSQFASGNDIINIVPHAALEDIIFNDPVCNERNVQVHYTPIVTEPGHYAFLCAISDKNGRRVEGIGESLEATLETEISRNYPTLMAVKRAFDDAAIKFLRIDKAYSDNQIDVGSLDEAADKAGRSEESKEEPVESAADTANEEGDTTDQPEAETAEYAEEPAPAPVEPPVPAQKEEKPAAKTTRRTEEKATAAAPAPATAPASAPPATSGGDKFDTTKICCGSMKRLNKSVREVYNEKPDAIRWIAWQMNPLSESSKDQQQICREFLASVGETEAV